MTRPVKEIIHFFLAIELETLATFDAIDWTCPIGSIVATIQPRSIRESLL